MTRSFRLSADEAPGRGLQRILRGQARAALRLLAPAGHTAGEREERIHRARKHFKRVRAALRLARPGAPYVYGVENRAFRDIGRLLSGARDAEAMIEALDRLGDELEPGAYTMLRRALKRRQAPPGRSARGLDRRLTRARHALERACERMKQLPLDGVDLQVIEQGHGDVLRRCRRAFRAASKTPGVEPLHEWRKLSKHAYYQGQLLGGLLPAGRTRTAAFDRINTLIGECNDLAVLDQLLGEQPDTLGVDTHVAGSRRVLQRRRSQLIDEALAAGRELFRDLR